MLELERRLEAVRAYRPPVSEELEVPSGIALRSYITGFGAAESCFELFDTSARFSVHLRRDDAPLLEALAAASGLGNVNHDTAAEGLNPSSTWRVGRQSHTEVLARWMLEADMYGRKRAELEAWAVGVEEIRLARATGARGIRWSWLPRWRLRTGADVPTHATFYRVFGGGWDTVLAAYRDRFLAA